VVREIGVVVVCPDVFVQSPNTVQAVECRYSDVVAAPICQLDDAIVVFEPPEFFFADSHLRVCSKSMLDLLSIEPSS